MKRVFAAIGICAAVAAVPAQGREWKLEDLDASYKEHLRYIVPFLQKFGADPQTRDVAKMQLAQLEEALMANSALTLGYESLVLETKGQVCESPMANSIAGILKQPDGIKAPVMFHPGTLRYVNAQYFRDLCSLYKKSPNAVSDIYSQQMGQIKAYTGGDKATSF